MDEPTGDRPEDSRETHGRLALPLLVPAVVFLFAVLVIYGLSRIYLELNDWKYREVSMATPVAIGIALLILLVSSYLASRPRVPVWQIAFIIAIATGFLTGGGIWAAVHEGGEEEMVVAPTATPGGGTPAPTGEIQVTLTEDPDFMVDVEPTSASAGSLTFGVNNTGSILHNLRVIKSDLAPDKLPLDDSGLQVDEAQVDVASSVPELDPGTSQQLSADLEAGAYVLICNVAGHYEGGMHTAFTVQ